MTDPTLAVYDEILRHFPPEKLLPEDDPAYAAVADYGGCLTCANGQPCQTRISEDIADILCAADLPAADRLACLHWLMAEEYSSLTHSIAALADEFTTARCAATAPCTADVLVFEVEGNDLLVLPVDAVRSEAHILALAQQEATRLDLSIDQISLRFAAG